MRRPPGRRQAGSLCKGGLRLDTATQTSLEGHELRMGAPAFSVSLDALGPACRACATNDNPEADWRRAAVATIFTICLKG